ncbi:MAG: hypothetical protein KGI70_01280 [Patescibacteria group bacterium]|nr:hypothetical protein [Patescibacteria group bacterium]
MVEIIPAILPTSFDDLKKRLERIRAVARRVQVDIVDGRYVRGKTWPYKDRTGFESAVDAGGGLPLWDEIDYEFDLMIEDPGADAQSFARAGASRIVIHARSPSALQAVGQLVDMREESGAFTIQVGVALGPQEQPDMLEPLEAQFDFVQVMGIDREGRQGEPFDRHALYLLERLRRRYPLLPLQVDGAVTMENAHALAAVGASRLIVGHALWEADDIAAAYVDLSKEANRP